MTRQFWSSKSITQKQEKQTKISTKKLLYQKPYQRIASQNEKNKSFECIVRSKINYTEEKWKTKDTRDIKVKKPKTKLKKTNQTGLV